ncbi:MAG: hypothetical protein PF495_10020 [Spirochaetales bacterium]|jgi:antitoxin component of RelBE/YafQ-DinJ toxin-antitoxin module|nr:hypothetical protein [Spirochaetales bacterium]
MSKTTINVQVDDKFKVMAMKKAVKRDLTLSQLVRKLLKEAK